MSVVLNKLLKSLSAYLEDKTVEEIQINEPQSITVYYPDRWEKIKNNAIEAILLEKLPKELATYSNQQFDYVTPQLATNIPNTNYRVQAVHKTLTREQKYNILSIRKQIDRKLEIEDFINKDKFNKHSVKTDNRSKINELIKRNELLKAITLIVEGGFNLLVSGKTGSGKTSFIQAVLNSIDPKERIITIEDSAEIKLDYHENKDQLIKSKTDSTIANVDYSDLINIAMRLRPTRILIGEIDTANTWAFMKLSNTGHKGMICTVHANSAFDSIRAIRTNASMAKDVNSSGITDEFIKSSLDFIVHIEHFHEDNVRAISELIDVRESL